MVVVAYDSHAVIDWGSNLRRWVRSRSLHLYAFLRMYYGQN
jgi:hypothetical protein